jgi:hypothetical protein
MTQFLCGYGRTNSFFKPANLLLIGLMYLITLYLSLIEFWQSCIATD